MATNSLLSGQITAHSIYLQCSGFCCKGLSSARFSRKNFQGLTPPNAVLLIYPFYNSVWLKSWLPDLTVLGTQTGNLPSYIPHY
jgi:hypothetical protein